MADVEGWEEKFPGFTPRLYERAKRAFEALDKDGSGSVETGELGGVLSGLGYELDPSQVAQFCEEIDSNADGTVTAEEFYRSLHDRMLASVESGFMGGFKSWKFLHWRRWALYMKIVSISVGVINIALAASAYGIFANASGTVEDLASTWDATPVSGLMFIANTSANKCDTAAGYHDFNKNPWFAGVPDKCDCTNRQCTFATGVSSGACSAPQSAANCETTSSGVGKDKKSKCKCTCDTSISTKKCTTKQTNEQCVDIPGWPATEMPSWRGYKLCTRFTGDSAVIRESHLNADKTTCKTGWQKSCGTGKTNATALCFAQNEFCPITQVTYDASKGNYSTASDVGVILPIIDIESASKVSSGSFASDYSTAGKTFKNPSLGFAADYFVGFDSRDEADVLAENGIPTRYATSGKKISLGFRRELGWKNDCKVSRAQIVNIIPRVDDLKSLLLGMTILIIGDFFWTLFEMCKFGDSTDFKVLATRTCADILCYGANLPLVILAAAAGGAISGTITDISGCAPSAALTASFTEVGKKAGTLAGTNFVIVVLKGLKMLFMSALAQHGIYVAKVACCGRKQANKDIELAFNTKSTKNPLS